MKLEPEIQTTSIKMQGYNTFLNITAAIPMEISKFLENKELNILGTTNKLIKQKFHPRLLDDHAHNILKQLQNKGWEVKIPNERTISGKLEKLYLRSTVNDLEFDPIICEITSLKELTIAEGPKEDISGRTCYNFDNFVNGKIPKEIGNLVNLEMLDICDLHLITGLPESMKNMTKLKKLYITGKNKVIEDIPECLFTGETGPLRNKESIIDIWRTPGYGGHRYLYKGSILDMPENKRKTPFMKMKPLIPGGCEWFRNPGLYRTGYPEKVKTWYGYRLCDRRTYCQ